MSVYRVNADVKSQIRGRRAALVSHYCKAETPSEAILRVTLAYPREIKILGWANRDSPRDCGGRHDADSH